MSELSEPTIPFLGGFEDSSDTSRSLRVRKARRDLALISSLRANAHSAANLFRDFHVTPDQAGNHPLRIELDGAKSALARWALMTAHQEFRTVDLARVDNDGDWSATATAEAEIAQIANELRASGRGGDMIERRSAESKLRIMVDPSLVSGGGLVAVRRKRLMLATVPKQVQFTDMRRTYGYHVHPASEETDEMRAMAYYEIDKVSEFVLDVAALRAANEQAALEVEAAIRGEAPSEITNHGRKLTAPHFIEGAIDAQDPMLSPAITTYFADYKYRDVHKREAISEVELVDV